MSTTSWFLLPLLLLALADEPPPTPAERVAALKRDCAAKRVKLASWVAGKKLGTEARAQYLVAIHLDPDDRSARSRLGHRKGADGGWSREREKTFRDARGARDKVGKELAGREASLCREEAAAFAALGEALAAEGLADLARPLLLRAFFLDPSCPAAARGLGLVPIRQGFGTPRDAEVVRSSPSPTKAKIRGYLSSRLGVKTTVMAAGCAYAEAASGAAELGEVARLTDQAHRLTSVRFGLPLQGQGWVDLVVARGQDQFNRFADAAGLKEPWLSTTKKIGSLRQYQPRHCLGTWVGPAGSPGSVVTLFMHEAAEDQLFWFGGKDLPAWLFEVVGMDSCLTLVGRTGQLCITWESSSGLRAKGALPDPAGWPALLLKRAATGRIARFEHMVTAKLTGLGREDVITAHAYYRYLLLTRREGLGKYVRAFPKERDSVKNFRDAFELAPEALTAELRTLLLGAPPELPVGRPAGK